VAFGAAAAAVLLTTAAVVGTRVWDGDVSSASDAATPLPAPRSTATVTRRDLVQTSDVQGFAAYPNQRNIHGAGGIVTELPPIGEVLQPGDALYQVDGHVGPVVMTGRLPMWRTLASGVPDGPDVAQLEASLADLGYGVDGLRVDTDFTGGTRRSIRNLEEAMGLDQDGQLAPTDVWFSTAPVRVATHEVAVGDAAEGPVVTVTSATQIVSTSFTPDQLRHAAEGDAVDVGLPDGTTAPARITDLADTAMTQPSEDGSPPTTTIGATITTDEALTLVDGSRVVIELVTSAATGVLAVPVDAIVATAGGGLAVETVTGSGTRLVEVTIGADADGWVEVEGDITEGTEVVTP
jgi:hypothetical protein